MPMANYSLTISTDKPTYGKTDTVVITAWAQPWLGSNRFEIQIWDDSNHMIDSNYWTTPMENNGTVTWKVPASVFTRDDPLYETQVLYMGHRAHAKFHHWKN